MNLSYQFWLALIDDQLKLKRKIENDSDGLSEVLATFDAFENVSSLIQSLH